MHSGSTAPTHELLARWRDGDGAALQELLPYLYSELRRVARRHLARERLNHTLQSAALVNEVYLRLVDDPPTHIETKDQFFAVAAHLMRRILVDHARRRSADKRNGGRFATLDERVDLPLPQDLDLLALDDALNELAHLDAPQAQLVELRFFAGLSIEEISRLMKVSPATVKRKWVTARAWLYHELSRRPAP